MIAFDIDAMLADADDLAAELARHLAGVDSFTRLGTLPPLIARVIADTVPPDEQMQAVGDIASMALRHLARRQQHSGAIQ